MSPLAPERAAPPRYPSPMSEDQRRQSAMERSSEDNATAPEDEEEDSEVGSPFDHPLFLPVLLLAMTLWFGYDGWFNHSIESVRFNRYGFFFLAGFTFYFAVSDRTSLRFLLPGLFVAFALWLGAFTLLGDDTSWWRNDAGARFFNRYGALLFAGAAVVAALREVWRGRAAGDALEGDA